MLFVKCDVFVMTLTDLHNYHLKRSINPVHYVYVFHGISSTHIAYRAGSLDHYDSMLCIGPHHIIEIRKYEELYDRPRKQLIEAGYYRLERIYDSYRQYGAEGKPFGDKRVVLIAPSWGAGNIIEYCGERLVKLLLDSGYEVILRPHPETCIRFPHLIDMIAGRFGEHPSFFLEKSIESDDSLLRSDVLISDYSGIILEYVFGTERPVLFLDVPHAIPNEKYYELGIETMEHAIRNKIGITVTPNDMDAVPVAIENLITKRADYKKNMAELREQYIFAFGRSSEIGAEHIVAQMKRRAQT